ncbi:MAG: RDD family protein [Bacteroidota bacterium]
MEIQQNLASIKTHVPVEDVFEDFDFKPLSEGLGFHHGNKRAEVVKEAHKVVVEKAAATKLPTLVKVSQHPFEQHLATRVVATEPKEFVQSDLSLFYAKNDQQLVEEVAMEERVQLASIAIRLSAFAIDLVVVFSMTFLTLYLVEFVTGFEFLKFSFFTDSLLITTFVTLFSCYFILYFTLLEKFQGKSVGKELLGLSVSALRGHQMTSYFFRSFCTLAGFLSLGLTNFVDLPGKITHTRVVRD